MCGIVGFFEKNGYSGSGDRIVSEMSNCLYHRGPDSGGVWGSNDGSVHLGHRRLSIQDLSEYGAQPMQSVSARYVIAFNGEIYNFLELKHDLEKKGAVFNGHSDTEVLLELVEEYGLERAVSKLVGMFAFAIYDTKDKVLHLVVDRIGEKPLYYGWVGDCFVFASELKAFKKHPSWEGIVDRDSLALYLRHSYVPSPYSIYKGIKKLRAGSMLAIPVSASVGLLTEPDSYWNAFEVAMDGIRNPYEGSEDDAINGLEALLRKTIRDKMISDVPLGAFLSGGIDSSTIVSMMQMESKSPIKTFSIGFHEEGYDEAQYARKVSEHLGTDHTEFYVTSKEAMDVIPKLPDIYDEPFSDVSQIPTYLVSAIAKKSVTVALSGDGGDELFGGYNRYFWSNSIWKRIRWMPRPFRVVLKKILMKFPVGVWDSVFRVIDPFLPGMVKQRAPADKFLKLLEILSVKSPEEIYRRLVSHWKNPCDVVLNSHEPPTVLSNIDENTGNMDFMQKMMYLDMVSYLNDDILTKVDRAAMSVSLETRVPFLDHRVVEFSWRIPVGMKVKGNEGKWLLKQVLYKHVPKKLLDRPKVGFGVPIGSWLRGPLREWAEELLNGDRLEQEGYFSSTQITRKWKEHLLGERNWQYYLWDILMFQQWLEKEREV